MGQPTSNLPADSTERREQFNKIMREVDQYTRQEKYSDALRSLETAETLDPDNPYVKAFKERIAVLQKNPGESKKTISANITPGSEEERLAELHLYEQKRASLIQELEIERNALREERERLASQWNEEIRKTKMELREESDKKIIERLEKLERDYARKIDLLGVAAPKTFEDRVALYRARLKKIYSQGEPTLELARDLFALKELLDLSYEDHMRIDTDVRIEQYVQVIEKGLIDGTLSINDADKLEELKQKFHIFPDETVQVEALILSKIRKHHLPGTILLADDDESIRFPIGDALEGEGFKVIICASVEEALEKLETERPDLIISDIKFLPGDADGFQFFQTVQRSPQLKSIPFILLSSLKDNLVVRSGLQLGVDDYLTKPVDIDLLIAVIEGKLKRSKND
ncbi:MAG: response regulator [Bacteroidota bacterium]